MKATRILQASGRSNTVGYIGLGAMGSHMFRNLVQRSTQNAQGSKPEYVIYDVNNAAMKSVQELLHRQDSSLKITLAKNPEEVGLQASTILSMVPTSKHVHDVFLGPNSVMSALKQLDKLAVAETLCLDSSTIEQSVSKSVSLEMRAAGADMMDAPVSGGVVGARDGSLAIMVGGDKSTFTKAQPFLQPMAKNVTHCGDLGAGLAAKIANNLLLGITMLGLSEAMLLGKNLGLNPQVLADIINNSTGRCWSSEINGPVPSVSVSNSSPPAHRGYVGGFLAKLAHKDLGLAVEAAKASGTPLELGKLTELLYRPLAKDKEWGSLDFSVIYKYLLENGVPTEQCVLKAPLKA